MIVAEVLEDILNASKHATVTMMGIDFVPRPSGYNVGDLPNRFDLMRRVLPYRGLQARIIKGRDAALPSRGDPGYVAARMEWEAKFADLIAARKYQR